MLTARNSAETGQNWAKAGVRVPPPALNAGKLAFSLELIVNKDVMRSKYCSGLTESFNDLGNNGVITMHKEKE